jgi:hypothetical protein
MSRALAGLALALLLGGCGVRGGYPAHPGPERVPPESPLRSETLHRTDAWLRHYLMQGEHEEALRMLGSRVAPRDALVRSLQRGMVLHAAGRHAESNAALEEAEREAEERLTRSVARAAGSLLVNDGVLEYLPTPSERAMIPYYRMLNYLALDRPAEARVEAGRLSALLGEREAEEKCVREGFLQYLSGLVYQSAGERNDALVSFRRAERAYDACPGEETAPPGPLGADLWRAAREAGVEEVADSAARRYGISGAPVAGAGEVVVLVEHGWVAYRAPEELHVPILPEEQEALRGDDEREREDGEDGDEEGERESVAEVAARVAARLLGNAVEEARWGSSYDEHPMVQWADAAAGAHILKLAWPVTRLEASRPARVRVVAGDSSAAAPVAEDLSAQVAREFAGRRALILTRAVGRALTKYLLTREVEEKAEKKGGELAGWVAARVANLAGNALERADTRSWSLLPDRISVVRLTLPPGEHPLRLEVDCGGETPRVVELGRVTVTPGGRVFRSARVWSGEP